MPARLLAAVLALWTAAPATAATHASTSSNWSGYAVTRSGSHFKRVAATWTVPAVTCATRRPAYSAAWVGLGGYHDDSSALEQVGTSADCGGGTARYSAWYELVPAGSVDLPLRVRPGDQVSASVVVTGRQVRVRLANRTTGAVVTRVLRARAVDTRAAEWIVEAPSLCDGSRCETQPLADFGTTTFANASATTTRGHIGTISDPAWSVNLISLSGIDGASPGELSPSGASFPISYGV